MNNYEFMFGLAAPLLTLLVWGVKTLPAERWQILAAVPIKADDYGGWKGLNLTFYGFFVSLSTTFGVALTIVLLTSVGTPLFLVAGLIVIMLAICVPASKIVARLVEKKRNTFTIAGAGFVAAMVLPPGLLLVQRALARWAAITIHVLPVLAAVAITYALSESIARLACLSFGCCYGKPLRQTNGIVGRMFGRFPAVFYGETKKVAYESSLAGEPLIPVQAITSVLFLAVGLAGLWLFLASHWRLAALVPIFATWGWRAVSESLRADHRGHSRISVYRVISVIAIFYLVAMISFLPSEGPTPNIAAGLSQVTSAAVIVGIEALWLLVFLYYGRSRVTASVLSFHVVEDRV